MDLLVLTPITFFGRVIDEKGDPISKADISYSLADSLVDGKNDTKGNTRSDDQGLFSITGHGMGLIVNVSKAGYYHLKASGGLFGYSKEAGATNPHPDRASPAIFVLRKAGKLVPLIKLTKEYSIAKDGTPVEISLTSGKVVGAGKGDIRVEVWTNDTNYVPNSNVPFDWKCTITVPNGGGLSSRTSAFEFLAPDASYSQSDEISMPASAGGSWRSQVTKDYFVTLPSGLFARMTFEMTAGGEHFFSVESYVNPIIGDRNLEADPQRLLPLRQ